MTTTVSTNTETSLPNSENVYVRTKKDLRATKSHRRNAEPDERIVTLQRKIRPMN